MFKVAIDVRALEKKLGDEYSSVVETAVDVLSEFALDRIRHEASEHLRHETHDAYTRALQVDREPGRVTIFIDDPKIDGIESGFESFDIKPGLLRSPKAKRAKDGDPYMDVPFEHRTTKRGKGTHVASRYRRDKIKAAAKEAASMGEALRIFTRGKKTIHSDMKVTPTGEAQTFRRVSKKSPESSWIHPGRPEGLGIFKRTAEEIERIKDDVVADIVAARSEA